MAYQLNIKKSAVKSLAKIPPPYYSNIKTAILDLQNNPRPAGYKQLKGREAFRIRIADYRVIYQIYDHILTIEVVAIGHRKDIY